MSKRKDTREELLRTALELIWSHNFGSVTVDEICKQAGAQKGSFYHFFPSKTALAIAAMDHMWNQWRPDFDQLFSPQVPPLERLRAYADSALASQQELAKKFGFVVGCPFSSIGSELCCESDGITAKAWEILERIRRYFTIAFRDAFEEGHPELKDYDKASQEVFTHYLGANLRARLSGSTEPFENLYERWCTLVGIENTNGDRHASRAACQPTGAQPKSGL